MMIPAQSEDEKSKGRREKSKEAISLAMQGKWEKAREVNMGILRLFPEDVEALNRLGKALLALGNYSEARVAFETAAKVAPHNPISKKNLERLSHLNGTAPPPKQSKVATPCLFIEEGGKSGMTVLCRPAQRQVLVKMAAGDEVKLKLHEPALIVEDVDGEYLGQVEPKLAMRLIRFVRAGNSYAAAITSINRQEISVIIWETHRAPGMDNTCSFPTRSGQESKVYWKDALLMYDINNELDEEEDDSAGWRESYAENSGLAGEEEPAEALFTGKVVEASLDDDEEMDEEE